MIARSGQSDDIYTEAGGTALSAISCAESRVTTTLNTHTMVEIEKEAELLNYFGDILIQSIGGADHVESYSNLTAGGLSGNTTSNTEVNVNSSSNSVGSKVLIGKSGSGSGKAKILGRNVTINSGYKNVSIECNAYSKSAGAHASAKSVATINYYLDALLDVDYASISALPAPLPLLRAAMFPTLTPTPG